MTTNVNLNPILDKFNNFAMEHAHDGKIVCQFGINRADGTPRMIGPAKGNAYQPSGRQNNLTRYYFFQGVAARFGGADKIPPKVQEALRKNGFGDVTFSANVGGEQFVSGTPLQVRNIKAVIRAVSTAVKADNALNADDLAHSIMGCFTKDNLTNEGKVDPVKLTNALKQFFDAAMPPKWQTSTHWIDDRMRLLGVTDFAKLQEGIYLRINEIVDEIKDDKLSANPDQARKHCLIWMNAVVEDLRLVFAESKKGKGVHVAQYQNRVAGLCKEYVPEQENIFGSAEGSAADADYKLDMRGSTYTELIGENHRFDFAQKGYDVNDANSVNDFVKDLLHAMAVAETKGSEKNSNDVMGWLSGSLDMTLGHHSTRNNSVSKFGIGLNGNGNGLLSDVCFKLRRLNDSIDILDGAGKKWVASLEERVKSFGNKNLESLLYLNGLTTPFSSDDLATFDKIAECVFGSGSGEGKNGGAGYVGLLPDGSALKFLTEWTQRFGIGDGLDDRQKANVRAATQKLRDALEGLAGKVSPRAKSAVAEMLKPKLTNGLDLLARTDVAKAINFLAPYLVDKNGNRSNWNTLTATDAKRLKGMPSLKEVSDRWIASGGSSINAVKGVVEKIGVETLGKAANLGSDTKENYSSDLFKAEIVALLGTKKPKDEGEAIRFALKAFSNGAKCFAMESKAGKEAYVDFYNNKLQDVRSADDLKDKFFGCLGKVSVLLANEVTDIAFAVSDYFNDEVRDDQLSLNVGLDNGSKTEEGEPLPTQVKGTDGNKTDGQANPLDEEEIPKFNPNERDEISTFSQNNEVGKKTQPNRDDYNPIPIFDGDENEQESVSEESGDENEPNVGEKNDGGDEEYKEIADQSRKSVEGLVVEQAENRINQIAGKLKNVRNVMYAFEVASEGLLPQERTQLTDLVGAVFKAHKEASTKVLIDAIADRVYGLEDGSFKSKAIDILLGVALHFKETIEDDTNKELAAIEDKPSSSSSNGVPDRKYLKANDVGVRERVSKVLHDKYGIAGESIVREWTPGTNNNCLFYSIQKCLGKNFDDAGAQGLRDKLEAMALADLSKTCKDKGIDFNYAFASKLRQQAADNLRVPMVANRFVDFLGENNELLDYFVDQSETKAKNGRPICASMQLLKYLPNLINRPVEVVVADRDESNLWENNQVFEPSGTDKAQWGAPIYIYFNGREIGGHFQAITFKGDQVANQAPNQPVNQVPNQPVNQAPKEEHQEIVIQGKGDESGVKGAPIQQGVDETEPKEERGTADSSKNTKLAGEVKYAKDDSGTNDVRGRHYRIVGPDDKYVAAEWAASDLKNALLDYAKENKGLGAWSRVEKILQIRNVGGVQSIDQADVAKALKELGLKDISELGDAFLKADDLRKAASTLNQSEHRKMEPSLTEVKVEPNVKVEPEVKSPENVNDPVQNAQSVKDAQPVKNAKPVGAVELLNDIADGDPMKALVKIAGYVKDNRAGYLGLGGYGVPVKFLANGESGLPLSEDMIKFARSKTEDLVRALKGIVEGLHLPQGQDVGNVDELLKLEKVAGVELLSGEKVFDFIDKLVGNVRGSDKVQAFWEGVASAGDYKDTSLEHAMRIEKLITNHGYDAIKEMSETEGIGNESAAKKVIDEMLRDTDLLSQLKNIGLKTQPIAPIEDVYDLSNIADGNIFDQDAGGSLDVAARYQEKHGDSVKVFVGNFADAAKAGGYWHSGSGQEETTIRNYDPLYLPSLVANGLARTDPDGNEIVDELGHAYRVQYLWGYGVESPTNGIICNGAILGDGNGNLYDHPIEVPMLVGAAPSETIASDSSDIVGNCLNLLCNRIEVRKEPELVALFTPGPDGKLASIAEDAQRRAFDFILKCYRDLHNHYTQDDFRLIMHAMLYSGKNDHFDPFGNDTEAEVDRFKKFIDFDVTKKRKSLFGELTGATKRLDAATAKLEKLTAKSESLIDKRWELKKPDPQGDKNTRDIELMVVDREIGAVNADIDKIKVERDGASKKIGELQNQIAEIGLNFNGQTDDIRANYMDTLKRSLMKWFKKVAANTPEGIRPVITMGNLGMGFFGGKASDIALCIAEVAILMGKKVGFLYPNYDNSQLEPIVRAAFVKMSAIYGIPWWKDGENSMTLADAEKVLSLADQKPNVSSKWPAGKGLKLEGSPKRYNVEDQAALAKWKRELEAAGHPHLDQLRSRWAAFDDELQKSFPASSVQGNETPAERLETQPSPVQIPREEAPTQQVQPPTERTETQPPTVPTQEVSDRFDILPASSRVAQLFDSVRKMPLWADGQFEQLKNTLVALYQDKIDRRTFVRNHCVALEELNEFTAKINGDSDKNAWVKLIADFKADTREVYNAALNRLTSEERREALKERYARGIFTENKEAREQFVQEFLTDELARLSPGLFANERENGDLINGIREIAKMVAEKNPEGFSANVQTMVGKLVNDNPMLSEVPQAKRTEAIRDICAVITTETLKTAEERRNEFLQKDSDELQAYMDGRAKQLKTDIKEGRGPWAGQERLANDTGCHVIWLWERSTDPVYQRNAMVFFGSEIEPKKVGDDFGVEPRTVQGNAEQNNPKKPFDFEVLYKKEGGIYTADSGMQEVLFKRNESFTQTVAGDSKNFFGFSWMGSHEENVLRCCSPVMTAVMIKKGYIYAHKDDRFYKGAPMYCYVLDERGMPKLSAWDGYALKAYMISADGKPLPNKAAAKEFWLVFGASTSFACDSSRDENGFAKTVERLLKNENGTWREPLKGDAGDLKLISNLKDGYNYICDQLRADVKKAKAKAGKEYAFLMKPASYRRDKNVYNELLFILSYYLPLTDKVNDLFAGKKEAVLAWLYELGRDDKKRMKALSSALANYDAVIDRQYQNKWQLVKETNSQTTIAVLDGAGVFSAPTERAAKVSARNAVKILDNGRKVIDAVFEPQKDKTGKNYLFTSDKKPVIKSRMQEALEAIKGNQSEA